MLHQNCPPSLLVAKPRNWSGKSSKGDEPCKKKAAEAGALNPFKGKRTTFSDIAKPLFFFDGGSFLEIIDRRVGFSTFTLDGIERDIYLYCTDIRTFDEIATHCENRGHSAASCADIIEGFTTENLMFTERNRYLALAVASRPDLAAQRIRAFKEHGFSRSRPRQK